jgi:hypothetical protein
MASPLTNLSTEGTIEAPIQQETDNLKYQFKTVCKPSSYLEDQHNSWHSCRRCHFAYTKVLMMEKGLTFQQLLPGAPGLALVLAMAWC